jgi:hypothetical protein
MQEFDAQILVLIEESAAALFNSFPDHFILFGGVTLILFHDSPRLSRDLDLLASPGQLPDPKEIQQVVRAAIQALAETLGLGQLEFRQDVATPALAKQWVLANQKPLFRADLPTIGGNVLKSQIVKHTIAESPGKSVLTPAVTSRQGTRWISTSCFPVARLWTRLSGLTLRISSQ